MLYQHLDSGYQERVTKKWAKVLDVGTEVIGEQKRVATAMILENTERECAPRRLQETYAGGMPQAGFMGGGSLGNGQGGGSFGNHNFLPGANNYGTAGDNTAAGVQAGSYNNGSDARIPTIVIPIAKRIFPQLLAHEVVGVQPMNGPVGYAFALRTKYGINGKGASNFEGKEIGYNNMDSAFTGMSGDLGTEDPAMAAGDFWNAYAGGSAYDIDFDSRGATLDESEWWNIGEDMPMAVTSFEKVAVEAKSRKLGAAWSLEQAEDMMNMQGVDIQERMVESISYEIQAELDRQLITEMVKTAIKGDSTSTWSPVSADGRNQQERIATLYTHLNRESNRLAIKNRRGPASWAIASPDVVTLIERGQDFKDIENHSAVVPTGISVSKVGTMRGGRISVFRDTMAGGDYALLGYKGLTPEDNGIIFCPYVPMQLLSATGQENFSPRIGVRTRYGIVGNLFGASNYLHMVAIKGLSGVAGMADGSRLFQY